jgi:hypothetical protein
VSDEQLHTAAEAATFLRCSEWWVKEQARQQRIPYTWIGGSYRFSDTHLAEIVKIFEVLPPVGTPAAPALRKPRGGRSEAISDLTATQLTAKPPRRSRSAQPDAA